MKKAKLNRKQHCEKQFFSSRTKESTIGTRTHTHTQPPWLGVQPSFVKRKIKRKTSYIFQQMRAFRAQRSLCYLSWFSVLCLLYCNHFFNAFHQHTRCRDRFCTASSAACVRCTFFIAFFLQVFNARK